MNRKCSHCGVEDSALDVPLPVPLVLVILFVVLRGGVAIVIDLVHLARSL